MLAYQVSSPACEVCPLFEDCGQEVKSRRIPFIKRLSKHDDGTGENMAFHWLTKAERKVVRERRKEKALEVAQARVYGSQEIACSIKNSIHKRAHKLFDAMTVARINIKKDSVDAIAVFSPAIRVIIDELKAGALTLDELADAIEFKCDLAPRTARREAESFVSILKAGGRVIKCGHEMELA